MMYAAIRLRGHVGMRKDNANTLKHLKLMRVNTCVVVGEDSRGMLEAASGYITYGEIEEKTLRLLVERRGDSEKPADTLKMISEGKLRPIFRLPPPSKGYKSIKKHFPKGDLGYRGKEINKLIMRML